jgi:hypothetical protein
VRNAHSSGNKAADCEGPISITDCREAARPRAHRPKSLESRPFVSCVAFSTASLSSAHWRVFRTPDKCASRPTVKIRPVGIGKLPFRREHYRTLSHRRLSELLPVMYLNMTCSLVELSKTAHF